MTLLKFSGVERANSSLKMHLEAQRVYDLELNGQVYKKTTKKNVIDCSTHWNEVNIS